MPAQTANLYLLEDLEEVGRTSELAQSDLAALHAVADWIKTYVVKPHKDLGRAGTVCPFVPGSLERKTLWLAPEQIADRDVPEVLELLDDYKRLLLDTRPTDGDDVIYNVIVVVFSDLPAGHARGIFDDVIQHLAVPSYVEDGILFGPYYEGNEATAIYNSSFRPFQSPMPFLFVRHGVTGDWKFFLDDEEWLNLWARRTESPQSTLLLRNYAACRGAWGVTNPRCDRLLRGSAPRHIGRAQQMLPSADSLDVLGYGFKQAQEASQAFTEAGVNVDSYRGATNGPGHKRMDDAFQESQPTPPRDHPPCSGPVAG